MSGYDDLTASGLADCLVMLDQFPGNTGAASMLDEATLAYGWRFPAIKAPQQAFSTARAAHMSSYTSARGDYDPAAWKTLVAAAWELATAMRTLGDFRLERCGRQTKWGECRLALDPDGSCHSPDHDD